MDENSPQTLTCPSCGAPLEFEGSSALIKCKFCKTTVLMPGFQAKAGARTPELLAEIRSLAQRGNLIEAIRRYREVYEVDLKDAKDAVESLAVGGELEARQTVIGRLTPEETGRVLEEVQELLRSENKIEAIKRYREATDVSLTKAKEVVERVEAALRGLPMPPSIEIPGEASPTRPASKSARNSMLGCVITIATLLFIGGILAFIFSKTGGMSNAFLIANGPAILLTPESGAPDVAAAFYDVNDETYLVGLVDAEKGKLRWQSAALSKDGYVDAMAQAGGLVYAASSTNLLAYRVSDGSLAWQVSMPDRLNYGDATLLVAGGRVLTSNLDQSIQAYDATTGTLAWSRRISGYDRMLRMVRDSLVVIDYEGDTYDYSLIFLNPVNGNEERRIMPGCPYDEYSTATLDPDSGFFYAEEENALYLIYDSSPGCIQRLEVGSGQVTWQTLSEDWFSFSPYGINGLLSEERIFFNNDNQLLAVDRNSGKLQILLADEDYEFIPLAVSNGTLVVRARRTRGTERFELRGIDPVSGSLLWQMDLGGAKPIDPPNELSGLVDDGTSGWTWNLFNSQLVLIQFQAAPNQVIIQSFDPTTGVLGGVIPLELKSVTGDFYSVPEVIGWHGELVYFSLDSNIYCVNILTGEVVFDY